MQANATWSRSQLGSLGVGEGKYCILDWNGTVLEEGGPVKAHVAKTEASFSFLFLLFSVQQD